MQYTHTTQIYALYISTKCELHSLHIFNIHVIFSLPVVMVS